MEYGCNRERSPLQQCLCIVNKGELDPKLLFLKNDGEFVSFKENWQSSDPLPDMRLLIIEPSVLKNESLKRLQDVGWGLCRVPRLEYMKVLSEYFLQLT